jgi:autoinducer 2-degrading protein
MNRFVIIAEFDLAPGAMGQFLPLMAENAERSLRDEPGCQQFDVLLPEGEESRVVLYEIYADAAAFAEHLRSAHYLGFDAATAAMVKAKHVTRLGFPGPAANQAGVRGR